MPRVKPGKTTRKWHKKVHKLAKGNWGRRSKWYGRALETIQRAGNYAFRDRRNKKREFRRLWIVRIGAASRENGISYSALMHGLKAAKIELDRKQLSELAINDPAAFARLAETAKSALRPAA
jgi:large subunit ribosomal protein L20